MIFDLWVLIQYTYTDCSTFQIYGLQVADCKATDLVDCSQLPSSPAVNRCLVSAMYMGPKFTKFITVIYDHMFYRGYIPLNTGIGS